MGPLATLLPDGNRLHLQHGPIDLIIGVDGDRDRAFAAARARFATVLDDLMGEIALLRSQITPDSPPPQGAIARRMDGATRPLCKKTFVTRMAAVAGSVADDVLNAMKANAEMERAYVNNGGDIALHLASGHSFDVAMACHTGRDLGRIKIHDDDTVRGIASSSRHGRSLSLGIADNVTVLATSAAQADAAATLIANAVDLAGHPAVLRRPASAVIDDSDLGDQLVVVECGPLGPSDVQRALDAGLAYAIELMDSKRIAGASLFLQDKICATSASNFLDTQRMPEYA